MRSGLAALRDIDKKIFCLKRSARQAWRSSNEVLLKHSAPVAEVLQLTKMRNDV